MAILITGGTGFIGQRLARKLGKSGKIILLAKHAPEGKKEGGKSIFDFSGTRIEYGDMKNKEDIDAIFRKNSIDMVYNLAANLDESSPDMWDDNVLSARNITEICARHGTRRIIHMSSCGVTGYGSISKEDSPYNPNTAYEKSKAEAERIIIASGLDYTIIRAPIIIGPNSIWLKIARAASKGYPIIGSGKNHLHLAYVDDVVDLLFLVRNRRSSWKEIFNVATRDMFTYEEVYAMLSSELGAPAGRKHLPVFLVKIASSMNEILCRITGKKPGITLMKSSIERLVVNREVSIEKARDVLGFEPKYGTGRALKETVSYFRENKML